MDGWMDGVVRRFISIGNGEWTEETRAVRF